MSSHIAAQGSEEAKNGGGRGAFREMRLRAMGRGRHMRRLAGGLSVLGVSVLLLVAGLTPAQARTCAAGGPCRIGDMGPGGGIVFYDAGSIQPWGRYLEAAPPGWINRMSTPAPVTEPPLTPTGVKVIIRGRTAQVSWNRLSGGAFQSAVTYRVVTEPGVQGCSTAGRSCKVSNLQLGREYAFSVIARNQIGESAPSRQVIRKLPSPVPKRPASPQSSRPTSTPRPTPIPPPKPVPEVRHGFRATSEEPRATWCPMGSPGYGVILPTGVAVGTGAENTRLVIANCGEQTAAGLAASYRGGGRTDWYLPAWEELVILMSQSDLLIPVRMLSPWWSSSQVPSTPDAVWTYSQGAWGNQQISKKHFTAPHLRPIRAF
jgi:hypothetical protein